MASSGERSGPYEILHWLEGAGDVALAKRWDAPDLRRYALKITDRVDKEVAALDLLAGHPSLPERIDVFRDQERDRWVIVLEWIDGEPLDSGCSRGMDAGQQLWVLHHLAAVLAHVHAAGRVHRDVKPGNVMIEHGFYEQPGEPRHVRLIDFDIVALARTPVTRYGEEAPGTPRYMAPEALRLAPGATNDRARDVFAFGVLGWELFAGRHPYGNPPPGREARDFYGDLYAQAWGLAPRGFPAAALTVWGPAVEAVLRACLSLQAEERPEMDSVLAALPAVRAEPVSGTGSRRTWEMAVERAGAASVPVVPSPRAPRLRAAPPFWPIGVLAAAGAVGAVAVAGLMLSGRPAELAPQRPAAAPSPPDVSDPEGGLVEVTWGPGSLACPTQEPLLVFGRCEAFRDLAWFGDELRALRRKGVGSLPELSPSFTLLPGANEKTGVANYYLNIHDPGGRKRANIWIQQGKILITDLTTRRRFWLGYDDAGQWYSGSDPEHLERVR